MSIKFHRELSGQLDDTTLKQPQISVIIPVYNGEKYLARTLESILQQSFTDFEILCIDDCSKDSSISILNHFAEKDARVRVVSTDSNQGFAPRVLNRYALPQLRGQYYTYSSQDDLFSEDWLEKMISRAQETDADAVVPDLVFYYEHETSKNHALVGVNGDRNVVLSNREAVALSLDWCIPGCALWRTSLVKQLGYADFSAFADEYSVRVFFFHCNRVVFSEGTYYYRQDNPQAITKRLSSRLFDRPYAYFRLYQFLTDNGFPDELCAKELEKSIVSSISMKQLLLRKKGQLSSEEAKESENKLRYFHAALRSNQATASTLKKQKGVVNHFMRWSVSGSYSVFDLLNRCVAIVFMIRHAQRGFLQRIRTRLAWSRV